MDVYDEPDKKNEMSNPDERGWTGTHAGTSIVFWKDVSTGENSLFNLYGTKADSRLSLLNSFPEDFEKKLSPK